LVRDQVSVIVVLESTQGALAAKAATQTIPIVFMQAADPVRIGLVDSLNRPGRNLTGINLMWAEVAGKRLELLLELVPGAKSIAYLGNPRIGLVPKQHSSGGRDKLGSISKQGDRYLRSLFVAGALAVIRYAKIHGTKHRPWVTALLTRRPTKVAAIALANKLARMAWAMMASGERYNYPAALKV
jgi:hypothetical protein